MIFMKVFPVYTGINRARCRRSGNDAGVPCIHRDKPMGVKANRDKKNVFPVYTGINLTPVCFPSIYAGVPCIHRDKPNRDNLKFSVL